MIFTIKHTNWYGFSESQINKKFSGNLTYIGQVISGGGQSWAFYKCENPDFSKGHKEFVMLCNTHVSGRSYTEALSLAETFGGFCTRCKTYIYSANIHDMAHCKCKACFVDGGNSYIRYSGEHLVLMKYNLITKKLEPNWRINENRHK